MKIKIGLMIGVALLLPKLGLADTSWTAEEQLTNSTVWAKNEAEGVSPSGTMHLLSMDNRTGVPHLFYQRKPDQAKNWSSHFVLSLESTGNVQAGRAALATDAGQGVYAVWEEYYNGTAKLYFRCSQDEGGTWQNRVLVAESGSDTMNAAFPHLVIDEQNMLHLVYLIAAQNEAKGTLMYRKGTADATTLSTPKVIKGPNVSCPGVASNGSEIVIYYQEAVSRESNIYEQIKFHASEDYGETWPNAQMLSDPAAYVQSREPKLVFDPTGNFYAVWTQGTGSSGDSVVFRFYDQATGLASDRTIASQGVPVSRPVVAVQDRKVIAAWIQNQVGNAQMRIKSSMDSGNTWGADSGTTSGNAIAEPCLINDRGNLHLFYSWMPTSAAGSAYQVWHLMRDDNPPAAPKIFSATHPAEGKSGNNRPGFTWQGADNPGGVGVLGYVLSMDGQPFTDPGTTLTHAANQTSIEYDNTANGGHFLHVRTLDLLGNAGSVAHYSIQIDNNSYMPGDQVWVAPSPVRNGRMKLHYFLSEAADIRIGFYDAIGRKLSEQAPTSVVGVNALNLDISDWANGTYFFRVIGRAIRTGNEAVVTKPFVVLK